MNEELIHHFIKDAAPEFQNIVLGIANIMDESGEGLDCAIKWGRLTYAKNADFHHWIAGIMITKKSVGLVFHFGGLLDDPDHHLIAGSSKFGRKIEYRQLQDVDRSVILDFLKQAGEKLPYFKEHWREIQAA